MINKYIKRLNYFDNKTLNKYIDVYYYNKGNTNKNLIKLDFKTKSNKLKENAINRTSEYTLNCILLIENKFYLLEHIKTKLKTKNIISKLEFNKFKINLLELKNFSFGDFDKISNFRKFKRGV